MEKTKNQKLNSFKKSFWLFCLYAFSGIAFAMPFIYPSLWLLGWIAPFGVLFLEYFRTHKKDSYFRAWKRGFCFFWFFGFVIFSWFFYLYPMDFLGIDKTTAVAIVAVASIGLPAAQAIISAFLFVGIAFLQKKGFLHAHPFLLSAFIGAFYCLCEYAHTLTWVGVPWGRLAVGQVGCIFNVQSASLFGSYFLSFLLFFCASLFAFFLKKLKEESFRRGAVYIIVALCVFLSNFTFGAFRYASASSPEGEKITAAAVQGNIKYEKKRNIEHTLRTYHDLTKEAADSGAALIVWPETAIPFDINETYLIEDLFKRVACDNKIDLIATAFMSEGEDKLYNISRLVHPDGDIDDPIYCKRRLVPFGEFLPMKDFIKTVYPPLATLAEIEDPLSPGDSTAVFTSEKGKIASLICFDSIYEDLARESVRDGAELLVISTNDSWFMGSPALSQHNSHAILRAIENNRYIVRSANTGISSIISPSGEVLETVSEGVTGFAIADIEMINENTLYCTIGNTWLILCLVFCVSLPVFLVVYKRKDAKEK